jgi:hypothetical protein
LQGAVVFFDPDTGMEPRTQCTAGHLRFDELRRVFERMDEHSVAVVFQFQRREAAWPESIAGEIQELVSPHVAIIQHGHLAFYVVAKSSERMIEARRVLDSVAQTAPRGVIKVNALGVL